MNADTALLLTTVLREEPCVDPTLQGTVQSVPFAVRCIAQQSYYTLYLISVVRALLNDAPSAYVYLIHRIQELEELHRDVHLGRAALVSSRGEADTVIGAQVVHTGLTLEALPDVPAGAERVHYALADIVSAVPRVLPASSLELRIVLIGGGTVGRGLLHTLLDDHPRLVHPNRITVITRQPEVLSAFAARGVLCVDRKHGRQAINQCDVLIVALQSHQVQEFTKQHFSSKLPGVDLDPPAQLQASCLVISCVAGMPRAKLSALLHHPEKLIIHPQVPTPGAIDVTAHAYERQLTTSTDLLIQSMADHDSFLRSAVVEADDINVLQIADSLVSQELAASRSGKKEATVNVPLEVARRRAIAAATAAAKEPYAVPKVSDVLVDNVPPPFEFLSAVWNAVRVYASVQLAEARQRDHKSKRDAAATNDAALSDGANGPHGRRLRGRQTANAAGVDTAESDGAFLCVAFAALPAETSQPLTSATLLLHGAPENVSRGVADSDAQPSRDTTPSPSAQRGGGLDTAPASVTAALRRRIPALYDDSVAVARDLTRRYEIILRDSQ